MGDVQTEINQQTLLPCLCSMSLFTGLDYPNTRIQVQQSILAEEIQSDSSILVHSSLLYRVLRYVFFFFLI